MVWALWAQGLGWWVAPLVVGAGDVQDGVFSHGLIPGSGDVPDKQPVCP